MNQPIPIKTPEEITIMREGGRILGQCLKETAQLALPGTPTIELDEFAENFLARHNTTPSFKNYHGYPATLCTNVNEQVVHSIPSRNQILQPGDILSIDCGAYYKGLHTDATVLIPIGTISTRKQKMIRAAQDVLETAIQAIKPDLPLIDLCSLLGRTIRKHGYTPIKELTGHGIGYRLHEPPHIPNQRESYTEGQILKAGMTLAIEPIFAEGSGQTKTLPDKWTIVTTDNAPAVQIEHTILITDTGCEALTTA